MQSTLGWLPFGAPQRHAYKPPLFKQFLGNFHFPCVFGEFLSYDTPTNEGRDGHL